MRSQLLRTRTYPDDNRLLIEDRCGRFQTMNTLEEESLNYGFGKGVRYRSLSCTRRAPELRHFTALETTSKGLIEHIDFGVCIAWWMVVVGKMAKCFRC